MMDNNSKYESPVTYAKAIELAGGLPLLLPYKTDISLIPQYVDLMDGMLFSGGSDLDPASYGEQYHPKAEPIDPDRQKFEMALLAEIEKTAYASSGRLPWFAGDECLFAGGSLNQFLPEISQKIEHRKTGPQLIRHPVMMDLQSQLGKAIGAAEVSVNTYHKQSVNKIGKGLRVIGKALDGVIEAFEDPSFPLFAAVQWHPERLANEKEHLALFKLLVERSADRK